MTQGAMTLAEGRQQRDYKTDATLVLSGMTERGYVLRTAFDSLSDWKGKYAKGVSPFYPRCKTGVKETALIDDEIWVFNVDGTKAGDIIDAINIGCQFYKVPPRYLLNSIYVKNLNAEDEKGLDMKTLVSLNKSLYLNTVKAIRQACEHFGVRDDVKLLIYSASSNPKISKDDLHRALRQGGAQSVETDSRELVYRSGSNDGKQRGRIDTNLHVARLY